MAKFCNKCNSPIEEGGVFCTECGSNDIRDDSPVTTAAVTVPVTEPVTQPVTEPATQPVTVPETSAPETVPVIDSDLLGPNSNSENEVLETEPETTPETTPEVTAQPIEAPEDPNETQIPSAMENSYTKEEAHSSGAFAEVPEYMGGNEATTTPVEVKPQEENIAPAAITTANPNAMIKGPKKKNNKVMIAAIAGVAIVCIIVGIVMFVLPNNSASGDPFSSGDLTGTGNGNNSFDYTKIFTPQNSFRVGDKVFGFVSIPNTWAQFAQTEGNKALQYTDSEDWVVTLYAIPTSQSSAYEYANQIYNSVLQTKAEDIKANKTKVAGYEALSVSAYYPEQAKYLTTWFFETKSGYTHYLAIEGPEKDGDNYNIIYSFKEDE
ncbi:MAG: hypothetical protein IKQ06_04925 [Bacilli bacterium]|nr:hypothetical protein [Bacilli bacterium]MBR6137480.1 hypothetical protein [Bacilli bacterium]